MRSVELWRKKKKKNRGERTNVERKFEIRNSKFVSRILKRLVGKKIFFSKRIRFRFEKS